MREEVRRMFCEYPIRREELEYLKFRITNFIGVDRNEVIEAMCFSSLKEDRVQTSSPSDKTASVAINYRKVANRMEDELFDALLEQYQKQKEELEFFQFGVGRLSGKLPEVISDMVFEEMEWQELEEKYGVSHSMVGKYRKKALQELEVIYSIRERSEALFMLS